MNKLSITLADKSATIEFEDESLAEYIPAFVGSLVSVGFSEEVVKKWLQKYLDDALYEF